jgi:hypothetical protein
VGHGALRIRLFPLSGSDRSMDSAVFRILSTFMLRMADDAVMHRAFFLIAALCILWLTSGKIGFDSTMDRQSHPGEFL